MAWVFSVRLTVIVNILILWNNNHIESGFGVCRAYNSNRSQELLIFAINETLKGEFRRRIGIHALAFHRLRMLRLSGTEPVIGYE